MSFGSLKQIDAGVLNVAWRNPSPANGSPFILLHGWPHDVYTFADVTTDTI
jgi:pimeloyl-ACP methyl ester carboxylesterase